MDFGTIDRKLAASNPAKPDANPGNPRYLSADEFIADVRLMFSNALTFNGPDHAVTHMGKRVEAIFDKQIKQMPPPAEEVCSMKVIRYVVTSNLLSTAEASSAQEACYPASTTTACQEGAYCSPTLNFSSYNQKVGHNRDCST